MKKRIFFLIILLIIPTLAFGIQIVKGIPEEEQDYKEISSNFEGKRGVVLVPGVLT